MVNLMEQFGIDSDTIPDAPDYNIEDGHYPFVIGACYIQEGTKKDPNKDNIVISYLVGDEGKEKREFFGIPTDPSSPTKLELTRLSFWKQRLLSLGFSESELNSLDTDDLVGINGFLELYTQTAKDGNDYQNIRNVSTGNDEVGSTFVGIDGPSEEPPAKPVRKAAPPAVAAKPVGRTRPAVADPFAK